MAIPTRRLSSDTDHVLTRCPRVARDGRWTKAGQALRIPPERAGRWSWR